MRLSRVSANRNKKTWFQEKLFYPQIFSTFWFWKIDFSLNLKNVSEQFPILLNLNYFLLKIWHYKTDLKLAVAILFHQSIAWHASIASESFTAQTWEDPGLKGPEKIPISRDKSMILIVVCFLLIKINKILRRTKRFVWMNH